MVNSRKTTQRSTRSILSPTWGLGVMACYFVSAVTAVGIVAMFLGGMCLFFVTKNPNGIPVEDYLWRVPLGLLAFSFGFYLWYGLMKFWDPNDVEPIDRFIANLKRRLS